MKQLTVAGKALTLLFAAAFLVACSSKDTRDTGADATAEAEREAQRRADAERSALQQTEAEQRRLEDAVAEVGNVFYFDYDSSTLKPQAQEALDAHIALLKENQRNVRLEGHTDERGTREYNMALGERRANSVRDYMVVNGIASHRIETISYGEEQPIAYGSDESSWSQNRRVELK
ncbi:peptidoglycan-associated lipoprotein Pal [Kineobactrum salinum]|uniref:Peptidoglycan-associated lipoprotein n=1 Tax=Kineobactrum salinum TaxID=2708301 RepID=A0A6C0TZC1_9GAMM|nr:peptidoglycan-associated lipoprotein Pal [Kineobactrum salinum]QIB65170.1 peptidoglycan-associated lipoprotein Pal [Kineobactrum salinum]